MKNIILLGICILFYFSPKAQDSIVGLSKFEKMATMPGKFCSVEEKLIGNMRGRNFTVLKIKEVNGSENASVLRIAPRPSIDSIVPVISYLNLYLGKDDLLEVIKDLQLYSAEIKKNNPSLNSYFLFVTSTDVRFTYRYYEGFSSDIYLDISKLHPLARTVIEPSTITFRKKEIDMLLDLFKLAASEM